MKARLPALVILLASVVGLAAALGPQRSVPGKRPAALAAPR